MSLPLQKTTRGTSLPKKFPAFEIALVVVMLAIHLYAAGADPYAFPNHWFARDDAYYYFKVAQNIAEGHGSAFDGINITNGYHPLWMLVCIPIFALARYDLILPLRILLMVVAVLHAATSVMLYRLVKTHLSHAVAILVAVFWSFNAYIHATVYKLGLETPIAVFFVVLTLYQLSTFEGEWRTNPVTPKRLAALGLTAALAMFSRLDLVFFALLAGIWVVFRRSPLRIFLPLDIALIFVSMTSAVLLKVGFESYNTAYASSAVEATLIALVVKIAVFYFLGLYRHPRAMSLWVWARQTAIASSLASSLAAGLYILLVQFGLGRNFPRSAFFYDLIFTLTLVLASRLAGHWFANPSRSHADDSPLPQLKSNWENWLREGAAYYGVVVGLLAGYMLFNQIAFGTSSPVSGQVKRWWGSMGSTAYEFPASDWPSYFGLGPGAFDSGQPFTELVWYFNDVLRPHFIRGADMETERYFTLLSIFTLIWLAFLFIHGKRSRQALSNLGFIPLLASGVVQTLSYTATSYGGAKEWYWVSQMILLTLAASLFLDLILKPLRRIRFLNPLLITAALAYGTFTLAQFWGLVQYAMPHGRYDPSLPYMEVVAYIEDNTFPGEIVGMTGGGNVGYFIEDRTIVNMDGLINSYEYFRVLQEGDAAVYLRKQGMTVIFANPRLLALPPYYGQFAPYLERYSSFGGKDLLYLLEEPKY
ncbi:MAG: hypothetical protein DCC59_11130 [Chloroflexi bacterium]|nr:hypothetical protein [Anaerolineales bacterium]RIK51891.1 MAG: hypothetical protein DCC59_11130 [Chloroflexota bacterium]